MRIMRVKEDEQRFQFRHHTGINSPLLIQVVSRFTDPFRHQVVIADERLQARKLTVKLGFFKPGMP